MLTIQVLKILYPEAVKHNNYSKTLTSVAFAGTVVGMLIFGWISDKIGRKFGMVRSIPETPLVHAMNTSPNRWLLPELLPCFLDSRLRRVALITVPTVCLPCFALVGESNVSKPSLLLIQLWDGRFLLGIGVGAEYPCGSVAASEQSEEEGISKNAQHRWFALATSAISSSVTTSQHLRDFLRHDD